MSFFSVTIEALTEYEKKPENKETVSKE